MTTTRGNNNGDFAPPLAGLVQQQQVRVSTAVTGGIADIQKDGTTVDTAVRSKLNFVTGANTTLTVADNAGSDRIDVTVAATPLTGRVNSIGGIQGGTGFSVSKTGTGTYSITFARTYPDIPTVVVTVSSGSAGIGVTTSVTTTGFDVAFFDSSGMPTNEIFHFLVFATN